MSCLHICIIPTEVTKVLLDPLELGLQSISVLGTERGSSARATSALNYWAISLTLQISIKEKNRSGVKATAHGDRSQCWKEEQNKMNIDPQGWSTLDQQWPTVLLSGVMAMAGAQCLFLLSSLWSFSLTSQAWFFWKHYQLQKFLECSIIADKSINKTKSKVHFFFLHWAPQPASE